MAFLKRFESNFRPMKIGACNKFHSKVMHCTFGAPNKIISSQVWQFKDFACSPHIHTHSYTRSGSFHKLRFGPLKFLIPKVTGISIRIKYYMIAKKVCSKGCHAIYLLLVVSWTNERTNERTHEEKVAHRRISHETSDI